MHLAISAARWLVLLVLGALVPKLLKALFTKLPPPQPLGSVLLQESGGSAPVDPSLRNGTHGLAVGHLVDGRFRLTRYIGRGKLSEIWEAEDSEAKKRVAIRFLLSNYLADASLVKRFTAAAHVTGSMWQWGTPPVIFVSKTFPQPYYVCEFHEGERLTSYVLQKRDSKSKAGAIDGVRRIAESLQAAKGLSILHGGITPDDILVSNGKWTLVDFERGCRIIDGEDAISLFPSLSFSAPECFEGDRIDSSCDVYNLARLLEFVYCEGELPTPFDMTSKHVLDRINCSLELKNVLRKATSIDPKSRYQTLADFVTALEEAQTPEKSQAAVLGVYLQEREKIVRSMLHCICGVSMVMLPTRALMTLLATSRHAEFGWVQLSDRPIVGAFHGLIGSVVWGSAIPLSFLLLWPLSVRRTPFGPIMALVMGGLAGFGGGAICSYLSVKVTSLVILKSLGWLLPSGNDLTRLHQTIYTTRMFWAFPLEGMLTGCGIGLYLAFKMKKLAGSSLRGLDPLPAKAHREEPYALQAALEFVARNSSLQLLLLCPVIFSWFVAQSLRPYGVNLHQEWHRTLGEGFVQAVGATGLVIGFFFGVVAPSESNSKHRIWRTPLTLIQKLSQLAKKAD
jgi:hypothetical protein